MKSIHISAAMLLFIFACTSKIQQSKTIAPSSIKDSRGNPMLLGIQSENVLRQTPFNSWYDPNYENYKIDSATIDKISKDMKNKTFEIFMGTWCGDSKREVPRIFKILNYCKIPSSKIKLVMLDYRDSSYKQSPNHEEREMDIHRVPDLLVFENGTELGRIVESPVESLEKDLAKILSGNGYEPHYKAISWIQRQWKQRSLSELIADSIAVLKSLSALAEDSYGLNTYGYVLCAAEQWEKADLVFNWNAHLFPKEARVYNALGDFYLSKHEMANAKMNYQKALSIDPKNVNAKTRLEEL
ncbi:MAG: hypothetical protein C5B52_01820 [Bacteroidetes bacterium]|nr:MAG: hypothetical protein C5B52_01820 [Bacteroidota bacterium]